MKFTLCFSILLIFVSCSRHSRLDDALEQSSSNRLELEKVLIHYQDNGLKLNAARFLIENMPGKYSVVAMDSNDGYKLFLKNIPSEDSVSWRTDSSVVALMLDSVSKRVMPQKRREDDIKSVRSERINY